MYRISTYINFQCIENLANLRVHYTEKLLLYIEKKKSIFKKIKIYWETLFHFRAFICCLIKNKDQAIKEV